MSAATMDQPGDTIAAISTPPGPGGLGVVRVSGHQALEVARRIFTPLAGWKQGLPRPKQAVVGRVHAVDAPANLIDRAVLLFFAAPSSSTGEDTVELTAHGGTLVMASLLREALAAGARLAEPGEFTRRAFLNGRMDLAQAEAVASLIHAATEGAMKVMVRQTEGALGRHAGTIRDALLQAKVVVESAIDFPEEEDVQDLDLDHVREALASCLRLAERLLATAREGIALSRGLAVAIIGTPNVGKSSLLNALLDEERAIVHEAAGTTRDFIEGTIDVLGIPMRVVDTAGIRQGAGSVEIEGILRTRRLMDQCDILLVVLDGSRPAGDADLSLLEETKTVPRVVVVNKADLPEAGGVPPAGLRVSARTGQGIDRLKQAIHDLYVGGETDLESADAVVTTVRQADALRRTRDACARAHAGLENGALEPELLAVDLDEALAGIGELTGEVTADEVLNTIFERFCIGK